MSLRKMLCEVAVVRGREGITVQPCVYVFAAQK